MEKTRSIAFSDSVTIPEWVLVRQLDDEIVILDLSSENYFGLDEIGAAMWNEIAQADSLEDAYESLLIQYEVEPDTLRKDILDLLELLVERRLLELRVA